MQSQIGDVEDSKALLPPMVGTPYVGGLAPSLRVTLPPVLREFCLLTLAITVFSVLYCYAQLHLFHRHYPYDWPFFMPDIRFSDFTIYQQKFHLFHQSAFFTTDFPFTYPAPMALLYEVFYRTFGIHALTAFLIFLVLAFSVPAILFGRALVARGIAPNTSLALASLLLFLSWPALILLDRANVEVFVWISIAAGTWAYSRGKEWTAAAWFGVAAALKLFPFVLLALFFTRNRYPKLLLGIAVFAATTLAGLAILGPTIPIAYHGIAQGLAFFQDGYIRQYLPNESALDHTPLAFLKTLLAASLHTNFQLAVARLAFLYVPFSAIAGLSLYFLRIRKMPWLNQLLLLSIAAIYFTPFSGDGTLMHLYPSFALCCFVAIDAWRRGLEVPGLRVIMYCFAFLFSIESFFVSRGHRMEGQAKCIALGILLVWALRYPLGEPLDDATTPLDLSHPDTSTIAPRFKTLKV